MATIQEIIAKRQELQATNPNATNVDARNALTTPTTPAIPPSPVAPTVNVRDKMAGKNVAERQAIRSGTPVTTQVTIPVAPVTPPPVQNVGDTTPITPAPVIAQEQVTPPPTTPTKVEPVDYTQAKQASGYNDATPEKKAIIDGIIGGSAKGALLSEKDALNALVSGANVPKQNTQAFRNAEFKANNFRKFNSMTSTQLLDNLKMGQIGTEMDQLLAKNPNYAKAKEELSKTQKISNLNTTMKNIVGGVKGTEVPTTTADQEEESISDQLMKKYGLDDANASAFAQFVASYEEMADNKAKLLANRTQLSNINRQINDTTTLLNQGIKDLKAQYPDMSASGIITLMGTRLAEFNDAITNLNSTRTLLTADIKDEMDLAKSAFDAKSADIQSQNQIRSALALNEAKADFEKQQAEAALNDPATAIKSVMDEYKKLGIPFTSTVQSRLAEFNASGKTLPQFLTDMSKNIQDSPAYKKYEALQQGQMSDIQKMQATQAFQTQSDLRNFAQQKELAKYNNDLNRQEFLWQIENDPEKKAKALALQQSLKANKSLFDVLGKNVGTYEGNRGYDLAGAIGDPLPAGGNWTVKSIDTAGEQVGSIFIGGKGSKPYGNTVVMQDENGNEIRYSHLQDIGVKPGDVLGFGDIVGTRGNTGNVMGANGEKLTADQLKAGRGAHLDVEIKNPSGKLLSNEDQVKFLKSLKAGGTQPLAKGVSGQGTTESTGAFSDSDIAILGSVTKLDKQGKATLAENGLTERDWANFNAGLLPPTAKQKQESQTIVDKVDDILAGDWTDAVGTLKSMIFTGAGSDRKVTEMKVQALKDLLAMANLDKIKGAMSDKDIEFLRNTATYLSTDLSETEFEKTLNEIKTKYANVAGGTPTTSTTQSNTGNVNTGGGQTQTYQGYTIKPF